MLKKVKKFVHSNLPLETRLFYIVTGGGIIAALVIGIFSIMTGLDIGLIISEFVAATVVMVVTWIAKKTGKVEACSCILLLLLNCIMLPFSYFYSGGIKSGVTAWFVFGIMVVFLTLKGKMLWIVLGISFSSMAATFVYGYFNPDVVIMFENEWAAYEDAIFSIIIVSLILGLVVRFQNRVYEEEQEKTLVQKEELERLSNTRNRFFANMSHEIRTPINTIIGLNEMILRDDISDEIAENAIHIQEASKMLLALINDILDMSKIESGKMEIVPTQYETGRMFSELVNIIWIRAHEKKLEFRVDISPDIPSMLYGDEVRIKQIVTNLLTNAVKYTPKGYVTLTARSEKTEDNRVVLTISVKDSGIGIKKEDMQNLFQSFQRVDEGTTAGIEGTGLGLAISSQLVEMMGGKITVDSIYQKGSVFTIQITQDIVDVNPMGQMDFMSRGTAQSRKRYKKRFEAPDARVLIVDDNEMNLLVAKKLLRETRIQVDLAKSGKECLEFTKQRYYHVIFMDHMMPEMDGVETLHQITIQENGLCREVPVIALTANVMNGADKIYRDKGFQGYLAKPINGSLMEAVLLKYLPKELVEYSSEEQEEKEELIQTITMAKRKRIQITTDCVCDLPKEYLDHYDIPTMYCYVQTEKARFCDVNEITSDNLMEYFEVTGGKAMSQTATVEEYETFFSNALSAGEQVIHLSTAQKIGGGYKVASQAAQGFGNVTVVDSGHLSTGLGFMVMRAAHMARKGMSVEEILKDLEKTKAIVSTSFLVPSADSLYRNGKINYNVKKICEVFDLHLELAVKKGKLGVCSIKTGNMRRCHMEYIRKHFKGKNNIDTRILFVTYIGCTSKQLNEFKEEIEKYQKFEHIVFQKASATISSNCGLATMGVLYMKKIKGE